MDKKVQRCKWPNLEKNDIYIEYHDNEWGVESHDERYLFEMFVLESFHCGLSWLIVLKKRMHFKEAFDNFDAIKIANYSQSKIDQLLQNNNIIKNKLKILATINNAKRFLEVQKEFGSFDNYIWSFTNRKVVSTPFDQGLTTNTLSDTVSKDLKKRGFSFMGSTTCFSYLEAIGVMNNHATYCFKHKK